MSGKYSYILSGANCFDNIWWFNKELSDDSLNKAILLSALTAKTAEVESVFKFFKTLCTAKTKAAYKCELMLKEFAPVEKKPAKKAAVKAGAKPKAKAPAKPKAKTPSKTKKTK